MFVAVFSSAQVYHASCLDLKAAPRGAWLCGWHCCDECGRPGKTATYCIGCTASWCAHHTPAQYAQAEAAQFVLGGDDEAKPPHTRFVICNDCETDVCL